MRYIILILVLMSGKVMGQSVTINGEISDSLSEPLSFATVLLLNAGDSSLVDFASTNTSGKFMIKNVRPGKYFLRISFVGYRTYFETIQTPSAGNILDLGRIQLSKQNKTLGEVTVTAERAPVVVKRDTIEYNASSFKTNPNENVEGLLKRMPGIIVRSDGKIIAQGQEVRKIEIEGKKFFGSDPVLATRNLPASAVDKVQVYDKKSDQAVFTGIDDGEKQKTINLKLKADRKRGLFGNVTGGAGNHDRFRGKLSLNRFNSGNQLSLLGMAGNINEQGFSLEDYLNFTGEMQQMTGGIKVRVRLDENNNLNGVPLDIGKSNGIMTNYAGGVNINHDFGLKTNINASYFVNSIRQDLQTITDRINYLPGNEFNLRQDNTQFNESTNHRLNFTIDQKLDSFNTFKFTTAFNYTQTRLDEVVTASNTSSDSIINDSQRSLSSEGEAEKSNSELLLRHKFRKQGRTLSLNVKADLGKQNIHGGLNALNRFFSDTTEIINQGQWNKRLNDFYNYEGKIAYTDRIGNGKYYEVTYSSGADNGNTRQEVFNLMSGTEQLDTALSNKFKSTYLYNNVGLSFRFVKKDYNIVVGANLKQTGVKGLFELHETRFRKDYLNFLPMASFKFDFTSTRHLELEYGTQVEQPTLIQLQPVVNNSDPMNIYVGNPNLRPAYNHSLQVQYRLFSPASYFSLFVRAQANYRLNAFSISQTINDNLVTKTMPVNVKYEKSGIGHIDLILPLKWISSRFNFGAGIAMTNGLTVINNSLSSLCSKSYNGNVQYNLNLKEYFNMNLKAELSMQSTGFGFEQPSQEFRNNNFSADVTCRFLKRFLVNMKTDYLFYKNLTNGYKQDIPMMNAYVSYFMFKNMRGELRLTTSNILNRTIGISQMASQNYFERNVTNSPGRYFMISFTYDLNKAIQRNVGSQTMGIGG